MKAVQPRMEKMMSDNVMDEGREDGEGAAADGKGSDAKTAK